MMVKAALLLIGLYRYGIRPLLGPRCRFFPSCSEYGEQALRQHGFAAGSALTLRRLLRCHPWHPGGVDEVPTQVATRWRRVAGCTDPACAKHPALSTASSPPITRH